MEKFSRYCFSGKGRRALSLVLSIILMWMVCLPYLPPLQFQAAENRDVVTLTSAYGDFGGDHKLYCIDKGGLAIWGIADDGDQYEKHSPSGMRIPLSQREQEYIFWGILTLQASIGVTEAASAVKNIKANSAAQGKTPITSLVTEEDLKALIYKADVRKKYPWLEEAAADTEGYLKMAGLISDGGSVSQSGKKIPDFLAGCTSEASAYTVSPDDYTIHFAEDGSDAQFIAEVPLLFSSDSGLSYTETPPDGWICTKTDKEIQFYNPTQNPPGLLVKFAVEGTDYASAKSSYRSEGELFEDCLQFWECVQCSGNHTGGTPPSSPTEIHQRMVWMELKMAQSGLFASVGGTAVPGETEGNVVFHVFRHAEDFISNYNVQLFKFDHETGQPLEGARFVLYERFDDKGEIDTERDGLAHIYKGGSPYASYHKDNPVIWDGFRRVGTVVTDKNGYGKQRIAHGYHYDKTFCNGHPAPVFLPVPAPEEDEETGEILNSSEIEQAKAINQLTAQKWIATAKDCEEQASGAFEGVHFHWYMEDVDRGEIESTAASGGEEGTTPSAGNTQEASAEEAYDRSGCHKDMEDTYRKFISLRYSYAFSEFKAREGYIRHDLHPDDIPVEIITTDSSENGANAVFSGEYSQKEKLEGEKAELSSRPQTLVQASLPVLKATGSEAEEEEKEEDREETQERDEIEEEKATPSVPKFQWTETNFSFQKPNIKQEEAVSDSLFPSAYKAGLLSGSQGQEIKPEPSGRYSHCSGADGEKEAWRIYDHRTEMEFHINKKDLDLSAGESEEYDAYGEAQGDGTLEGAVYGLFAAEDIRHPDGKTGVVYRAGNLAAVAASDRNGDASFLANTEAPGRTYDYKIGMIVDTPDGWAEKAPENLYTKNILYDDYTLDQKYKRSYTDNEKNNGNCWIGRPILEGSYYVKELSRSEGYELSVGNKKHPLTNRGQDLQLQTTETGEGYAVIASPLYAEEQTAEDGTGAGPDELFFAARSRDTKNQRYDLLLSQLPKGVRFYRKETGMKKIEVSAGTGTYEKVFLKNPDGSPRYIKAEYEGQYPRYNEDGSLMTEELPVNRGAEHIRQVPVRELDLDIVQEMMLEPEKGMTESQNQKQLLKPVTESELLFVKGKVERILRKHGKATPKRREEGGKISYSDIRRGIFDRGVRKGEPDQEGISGVKPGEPASDTVYGMPVKTLVMDVEKEDGSFLTVEDAVLSVLDYYNSHPYYSYGGIDAVKKKNGKMLFTIYAGISGNPKYFMVLGTDPEEDSIIFQAVPWLPPDESRSPRLIYADYSNNANYGTFGTYREYREIQAGSSVFASAFLVPDAEAAEDGSLIPKTILRNEYYKPGELVRDRDGNLIQAFEYREILKTESAETEEVVWKEILAEQREDGTYIIPVDAAYTDSFGVVHTNQGKDQTIEFKAVLPEKNVALSQEDVGILEETLMPGFTAGKPMGSASYVLYVKKARAKACLDAEAVEMQGENSYVVQADLSYPGQEKLYEDQGTRICPAQVHERPIRQRMKISKDIYVNEDGTYDNNTYGANETETEPGFQFKAYLKSNLERLYRDEEGTIVWMDRNGNELPYEKMLHSLCPQSEGSGKLNVPKIYTKVLHQEKSTLTSANGNNILSDYKDPKTADENAAKKTPFSTAIAPGGAGVIVNAALYSYRGKNENAEQTDQIRQQANKGYTRILELEDRIVQGPAGPVTVQEYNYEKFFDALETVNADKWDTRAQTYTSWRPLGNKAKRTEYAVNNAKASDRVRQFALTWYLDDEAAKLVKDNGEKEDASKKESAENLSSETVYDEALNAALEKAYNYLNPFFRYDLDEIYALCWDSEKNGGADEDRTTLAASRKDENQSDYYGLSEYLPYGTYVIAEQQPKRQMVNRQYRIDCPKEIQIPSIYEVKKTGKQEPELSRTYEYQTSLSLNEQAEEERFLIRFGEEWDQHVLDQREYVIRAHNHNGDFEIYKYGLEPDKLKGRISYEGGSYDYQGFSIVQDPFEPWKDYYNPVHQFSGQNLTEQAGGNQNSHYFADDKNKESEGGKEYRRDGIEECYSYGSVSEQAGTAQKVWFEGEQKDVKVMQGIQTAYEGQYGAMLVPYSVLDPVKGTYEPKRFRGYADRTFRNTFYSAKLRIEKLDSETHENLLHDGAVFMIYKAARDNETGKALFYEQDTLITGSREFLEAMGASDITPVKRAKNQEEGKNQRTKQKGQAPGALYSGMVKAQTPVCREEDRIVMKDENGKDTGQFAAFSTLHEIEMKQEDTNRGPKEYRLQAAGYLTTPEPLGAGVYVLAEIPPRGYIRTAPIAVEIYSDQVSYYKEGKRDQKILAAIYEDSGKEEAENENSFKKNTDSAQIYVENIPIKLKVEKLKKKGTVTFQIGERVDGNLTEIGGNPALQYAYDDNGIYLGYAYPKGTLERLSALKKAGEQVELVYEGTHFAGYGYVTKTRAANDDKNPYTAGARMTLFDAIELKPSGDTEDLFYEGLEVRRNINGNVKEMIVKKGYAGQKTELVKEKDDKGKELLTDYITGFDSNGNPVKEKGYVWKEGVAERPDTEILYYDLDSLSLTWKEKIDGKTKLFGWNKSHQKVSAEQIQADGQGTLFAFKGGKPYLEFSGGDLTKLSYHPVDKVLKGTFAVPYRITKTGEWKMGKGTLIYHLDSHGNRDSLVDPETGMAYVVEPKFNEAGTHTADRILVWPIETAKDKDGNITARDKITTSRIATVGENRDGKEDSAVIEPNNQSSQKLEEWEKPQYSHRETGFINGTWGPEQESHKEETVVQNLNGQNMNREPLFDLNNGEVLNFMDPVYDEHGLVLYYQRSNSCYDKGTELYDRNGDFIRYKNSDNLEEYNRGAYALDSHDKLFDGKSDEEHQIQDRLYHRLGESYILENSWISSDRTPNDPFTEELTEGQADFLKRIPAGTYIVEELETPAGTGYTKAFPVGVTVEEEKAVKNISIWDDTTKGYFEKIDGEESGEEAFCFTNQQMEGAELVLYPAKKVSDPNEPDGWRLEKISDVPCCFETTNSRIGAREYQEMRWRTDSMPYYVEGIPAGPYILEELSAPPGFLKAQPKEIWIEHTPELQNFRLYNDHTKTAFYKYSQNGSERQLLSGAEFTLYEAQIDENGAVAYDENGNPVPDTSKKIDTWITDDATDYTDTIDLKNYPNAGSMRGQTGFALEFKNMYETYGVLGKGFSWSAERRAERLSKNSQVWLLEDGSRVITEKNKKTGEETVTFPLSMSLEEREGFKAAYKAKKDGQLTLKWIISRRASVEKTESLDVSLEGGKPQKYPENAKMFLRIEETGKTVLADVRYNGSSFEYHYKFDYRTLPQAGKYANAWLTEDGGRRVDYLSLNRSYVLEETRAPKGFVKADPILVKAGEEHEIQKYKIFNEKSALAVSKRSSASGKELAGAKLALYRADEHGMLNQTAPYLIDSWISGTDGSYTEKDLVNGLIPEGFSEGDLKPHYLLHLSEGYYYLTEQKAPPYYQAAVPVKFYYSGTKNEEVQIETMVNEPIKGELIVHKTDQTGGALHGAVFELSAHDAKGQMVSGFPRRVSDINGTVRVLELPVGKIDRKSGKIEPYRYRLKEVLPPEGFAVNPQIYTFIFQNGEGDYSENGLIHTVLHEQTIKNDVTKIYLEKKELESLDDSGTEGIFVEGACMAVYRISEINDEGEYTYTEKDLVTEWLTSSKEKRHLLTGLTAGCSYVLVEKKAPEGYALMNPLLFTLKEDGRGIASVSNHISAIKVNYRKETADNPDSASIDSIAFRGRTAVKTELSVLDEKGTNILTVAETGEELLLSRKDGLKENEVYVFEERTFYSDGSSSVSRRFTRRVHFSKDGFFVFQGRRAVETRIVVTDQDGEDITKFTPMPEQMEIAVQNTVNPENPQIVVKNKGGQAGAPIKREQLTEGIITWYNPSRKAQDIVIQAEISDNLEIIDTGEGVKETGNGGKQKLVWRIRQAAPLSQGNVKIIAETVSGETAEVAVKLELGDGQQLKGKKTVPVLKEDHLTVYNELTGSGAAQTGQETSLFTVKMWNRKGDELAGTYAYTGSRDGTLKSGDTVELAGNEFITINPVLKGCTYEVSIKKEEPGTEAYETEGAISEEGSAAWFTRRAEDTSERAVFSKGKTYLLTENTVYSDGKAAVSSSLSFTLDEQAGISVIGGYDKQTELEVHKTDFFTGEAAEGAVLQLYRLENEREVLENQWTSGKEPFAVEGLLPGYTYRLREKEAPDGYGYAEDITFTLNQYGAPEILCMEDRQTQIIISKKDITNQEELPGAHLQILDQDGMVMEEWTSGPIPHKIQGKLTARETYTLREKIPADGYALAKDIEFTVNRDGSVNYVEMTDDTTKVRIYKNAYRGSDRGMKKSSPSVPEKAAPIKGAVLQILNEDKTPAMFEGREMIFTTGETFAFLERKLTAGKTYWLHEVKPAPGYGYAEDIKFTVSMDGKIDVVVMEDKPTKAVISKKDITGEHEVPGCEMQLMTEDGEEVERWISGTEPHEITGKLEADRTYILTEVKPAPGYAYGAEVKFTVNHDGSANRAEMRDDVTKAEILKIDGSSKKPLAGAELEILDETGNCIERWISEKEPHKLYQKLEAGKTYILHERKAPTGYILMEDQEFTVSRSGETVTVTAENRKKRGGGGRDYVLKLKKTDENGRPLSGASFTVTDEKGKELALETEEGGAEFRLLLEKPQTVTVTEVSAPAGYETAKKQYQICISAKKDPVLINGDDLFYQDAENSYTFIAVNKKKGKLKGKITACYDEKLYGNGALNMRSQGPEILSVKTGDDFPAVLLTALFAGSAAGLLILFSSRKRRKDS